MAAYSEEIKTAAKMMYLRRCSVRQIVDELSLNNGRVVYQWAEKGHWDKLLQHETVEQATTRKLIALIEKENKTNEDYKEITQLSNLLDKLSLIDARKAKALKQERSSSGDRSSRSGNKKDRKRKNDISEITQERLDEIRQTLFFAYQHNWHANLEEKIRFILKSRQIGATYYFAYEAFENAVLTGDNQIFLSASKSQAYAFKAYILKFALEYFEIELKGGDVITLSNGAELRFCSTNARTAQSFSGHYYCDEVFWIPNFEKVDNVASAMASQKKWRMTYISTPSTKSHGAYPFWSGEKYNKGRTHKASFDFSDEQLLQGIRGKDRMWRNKVTIVDALNQGCGLFDIEYLRDRYSKVEFDNLFMCHFLEAGLSVFKLDDLLKCSVDSIDRWPDYAANDDRPFLNRPVWMGYDPARKGDKSCVVIVSPPAKPGAKFRVLKRIYLGGSFQNQANRIKSLTEQFNVQFIGVDCTGIGLGVFEKIQEFYPHVHGIHYGIESKTRLVLKGMDIVESQRIQWDAEYTDIPQGFIQIRQDTTRGGMTTFTSGRDAANGHCDSAWATLNAISNEPLTGANRTATIAYGT